jgi:uncharacterized coiled-coil DUF342 family protein
MSMNTGISGGVPEQSPGREGRLSLVTDQEIENAAMAGAAAIRNLIGERNELRRERDRLTAVNGELRDQIGKVTLARDRYVQLASDLYAELHQIHLTIQSAFQKSNGVHHATEKRDSNLVDLARRFSPADPRAQGKRE